MADIDAEREMRRSDIAGYLRMFADELDAGETTNVDRTGTANRPTPIGERKALRATTGARVGRRIRI